MFPEAVSRYHELLSDPQLAESSRALLDEGLERAKLIFGGRRLSPYLRPHFVSTEDFQRIRVICETVWSAIQKVKDAAVQDSSIVTELGLTQIERELVLIDPGYSAVSPTARLDSFLTGDAYSFVELNGESPATTGKWDPEHPNIRFVPEFLLNDRKRASARAIAASVGNVESPDRCHDVSV